MSPPVTRYSSIKGSARPGARARRHPRSRVDTGKHLVLLAFIAFSAFGLGLERRASKPIIRRNSVKIPEYYCD